MSVIYNLKNSVVELKTIRYTWKSTFKRIARSEREGTCAETRFGLSAKRTSPFNLAGGQFSRLLAAEVCASAVVMVVTLDTPCSEVGCKTTGYPLHSHLSPTVRHRVPSGFNRAIHANVEDLTRAV